MRRWVWGGLLAPCVALAISVGAPPRALADVVPAARACTSRPGSTQISLRVTGFRKHQGIVNIFVFGSNPADFLSKDRRVARLWFDVPRQGDFDTCIPVPAAGRYALAVHHDLNRNLKRDSADGIGYSRNPDLSLFHLKPGYAESAFVVDAITPVTVVLNYRDGLAVRPISPR